MIYIYIIQELNLNGVLYLILNAAETCCAEPNAN